MSHKIRKGFFITSLTLLFIGFLINPSFVSELFSKNSSSHKAQSSFPPTQETVSQPVLGASDQKSNPSVVPGEATIARILDGDTVKTTTGETIRLIGINAPESSQPFSKPAQETLSRLVLGKQVKVEHDVQVKDSYGRTLGYIYSNDVLVNKELLQRGLAVIETIQPNSMHADEFLKAQQEARGACIGLWQGLCAGKYGSGSIKACVEITKIQADAKGLGKNGEFITFTNMCSNPVSLVRWLLKDSSASNSYTFKQLTLTEQSAITLHTGCGQDTQTDLYWQCPERKNSVWNNDHDHAFVYNEKGELVADYQY